METEEKKQLLWLYRHFGEGSFTEEQGKRALEEYDRNQCHLLSVEELKKKYNIRRE